MAEFLIFVSAVLVLGILYYLFKITRFIGVVKGSEKGHVTKSNKVNAGLMIAFLVIAGGLIGYYSVSLYDQYTLPVASEHGSSIDNLFWITTAVTGVVFIITQVLLFYFSWRYQHNEKRPATFYPHNDRLEVIWTVIPAIAMATLVFTGLIEWNKITDAPPAEAEVIELMGYQFAWGVRYPGKDGELGDYDYRMIDVDNIFGMDFQNNDKAFDDFTPREIHLPKGHPVLLKIRARDVLHSVFLPHFRVKMDAVPGMPTQFWFTPNKSTAEMRAETGNPDFNYELACTEVCGRGHFSMRLIVVVDEPAEYAEWKASQEPWLKRNPDYLANIPSKMKELAMYKSGIKE